MKQITSNYIDVRRCESCNFECSKTGDWNRHIMTAKHRSRADCNKMKQPITSQQLSFDCECGYACGSRSSMWRHKKKCELSVPQMINEDTIRDILKTIAVSHQQNEDFKKQILEQQEKILELSNKAVVPANITNITNNTTTNTNNNINFNMFLEQYCKDAITIQDFIKSIKTTHDDVLYLTKHGNREGVSKIITAALDQLCITERPIHCTDTKRHTTYIKDSGGWNKDQSQANLKRLCNDTQHKCMQTAVEILESNPNYKINGTPEYEERIKMMAEVTTYADENQVIRTIEDKMHITKDMMLQHVGK
jgi:hypothetical protein